MDKETRNIINNAKEQIFGLFFKNPNIDKDIFNYINYEIYKELSKLKDSKYLKLLDKDLIRYVYTNDFLKYGVDVKDPIYFIRFLTLYLDYDKKGNYIYRNMAKYIYFTYIRELKISNNKILNYLLHCYKQCLRLLYQSHRFTLEEIQPISRLLVFLVTYLYMNDEILGNNEKELVENRMIYKIFELMMEDDFYDEMKLNGAFNFIDQKEEEDIKIYYIEKAIETLKENVK